MLTDRNFLIGVAVGVVGMYLYGMYAAGAAGGKRQRKQQGA